MLALLAVFHRDHPIRTSKINLHISLVLILCDLIWLIVMAFVWDHSKDPIGGTLNDFWKGLSWMHSLIYFLVFVEIGIKGGIAFFCFGDFKFHGGVQKDLFNFNYNLQEEPSMKTTERKFDGSEMGK